MDNVKIIETAFELLRKECLKHDTYSACKICPFGLLCKRGVGNINDEDVDAMINKYKKYNEK